MASILIFSTIPRKEPNYKSFTSFFGWICTIHALLNFLDIIIKNIELTLLIFISGTLKGR